MIDRYTEADLTPPYGNGISESSANSVILPPTANESASPDKQYKQMSKKVNNKSKNKKLYQWTAWNEVHIVYYVQINVVIWTKICILCLEKAASQNKPIILQKLVDSIWNLHIQTMKQINNQQSTG